MADYRSKQEIEMDNLWEYIEECGIATREEIGLVIGINGKNLKSLEDILYIRTGYHSLAQIQEEEE